jgi:hypothetical protein
MATFREHDYPWEIASFSAEARETLSKHLVHLDGSKLAYHFDGPPSFDVDRLCEEVKDIGQSAINYPEFLDWSSEQVGSAAAFDEAVSDLLPALHEAMRSYPSIDAYQMRAITDDGNPYAECIWREACTRQYQDAYRLMEMLQQSLHSFKSVFIARPKSKPEPDLLMNAFIMGCWRLWTNFFPTPTLSDTSLFSDFMVDAWWALGFPDPTKKDRKKELKSLLLARAKRLKKAGVLEKELL